MRAVDNYLAGAHLDSGEVVELRAYLREWMRRREQSRDVRRLRERLEMVETHEEIERWLTLARVAGLKPLSEFQRRGSTVIVSASNLRIQIPALL